MKRSRISMVIAVVMMLIMTACGGNSLPSVLPTVQVAGVNIDIQGIINQAREYYNEGVTLEGSLTTLYRAYEQAMSTFRLGVRDLLANNDGCFADVARTESEIAVSVMGGQGQAELVNALATGSVSGEAATVACVQLRIQIADYTISHRQNVQDRYMAMFEVAVDYRLYTTNYPEVAWINDLLTTYLDTTQVYEFLGDNGIGVSDWSWLPTANLSVTHSDETLCRYYMSGDFMANISYDMQLKFTGHQDALARLYRATWNPALNAGRGQCTMTRMAALEYMTRSILSGDTRTVIETGEDMGVFPTPAPLAPVPATPLPQ